MKKAYPTPVTAVIERMFDANCPRGHIVDAIRDFEISCAALAEEAAMARAELEAHRNRLRSADRKKKREKRARGENSAENVPGDTPSAPTTSSFLDLEKGLSVEKETERSNGVNTRVTKASAAKGFLLPEDFRPKPKHYDLGADIGLDRAQVDSICETMRDWCLSNAHRPVAKKSNWDSALNGFIKRDGPEIARKSGKRPLNSQPTFADIARRGTTGQAR